jgi:hypothetical protein
MPASRKTAGDPAAAAHHVREALAPHLSGLDPLERAQLLDGLSSHLRVLAATEVRKARDGGYTWARVGLRLGVSRQAAQQRFGEP